MNKKIGIIGGGITGLIVGIFLAKEGHNVSIFEKNTLLSETSSKTTKLLHGGLRYLENFHFNEVKNGLNDRSWWLENFPKQTRKLKIAIPFKNKFSLALILAGAIGNVIDSIFYGYLFTNSYFEVATLSPGSGYDSLFFGSVVDMFQFPLFTFNWPDWIPSIGGNEFTFFEPVFNIADSSISIGIFLMIIFNNKIFPKN